MTFHVSRFNYTFQTVEEEFADALMDVKHAIEDVRKSQTLRQVLGSLLAIGNFLNGRQVGVAPHTQLLHVAGTDGYTLKAGFGFVCPRSLPKDHLQLKYR